LAEKLENLPVVKRAAHRHFFDDGGFDDDDGSHGDDGGDDGSQGGDSGTLSN
jgi:nucleoid-associated protein YgaU